MAQQYSYGYGYAAGYGYGQPATTPLTNYMTTPTPQVAAAQPRMPVAMPTMTVPQVPTVGYSPYQAPAKPPPPPTVPAVASQQASAAAYYQQTVPNQQQQTAAAVSYYGYQSYPTPAAVPAYPPYYPSQPTATSTTATPTRPPLPFQPPTVQYRAPVYNPCPVSQTAKPALTNPRTTFPSVSTPSVVSYPAYKPPPVSTTKPQTKPRFNSPQGAQQNAPNLTPQQKNVIAQYIQSKSGPPAAGSKWNRKPSTGPNKEYYCEVCKISAASAGTYKTHLDGKNHKKKVAQQRLIKSEDKQACEHYCELCDVVCSNSDSLEAHNRGSKHQKVLNLHRRLGKTIPTLKLVEKGDGKKVLANSNRIMFVGGKTLHSTNHDDNPDTKQEVKVYPPNAIPPKNRAPPPPTQTTVANKPQEEDNDKDSELVGDHLVRFVKGDPKFPHALYKCEMCDCYFNDDYAKKAHVKGRRHRLNYKRIYQPDLYIEPTNTQKKEFEKKNAHRQDRTRGGRGGYRGRGQYPTHDREMFGDGGWDASINPEEEDVWDGGWDASMNPDPSRDPHDDILVMDKHKLVYPPRPEMKAIEAVVCDVEKALKLISDELMKEAAATVMGNTSDESLRNIKGVMRIGAYAHGILLKGECSVEIVLMCAKKPTMSLFNLVTNKLAVRFECFNKTSESENIYNITPLPEKATLTIISQVNSYRVIVSVTFTSTAMRQEPSALQQQADQSEGVLNRQCCLAALAALRHTKWFKTMSLNCSTHVIILRVMKDICRRVPAWGVLDAWMLELLVMKCVLTSHPAYSHPGDVFRRTMECVASGIFLPGGRGLYDPCEKELTDACAPLSAADRSNITLSAQHALRLIAFNKLHLVLGVDPLPTKQPEPWWAQDDSSLTGQQGETGVKRKSPEDEQSSKKIKIDEQ